MIDDTFAYAYHKHTRSKEIDPDPEVQELVDELHDVIKNHQKIEYVIEAMMITLGDFFVAGGIGNDFHGE